MPEFFWTAKCFESIIFLFSNSFWLKLFFNPNSIRPNIFWTQCFFTIQFFDKKVFWAKNFDCNVFWTQSSFGCYFLHRNFFIRNFYKPKILTQRFLQKKFCKPNFILSKYFLVPNFFDKKCLWTKYVFRPKFFWPKSFWTKIFYPNFFGPPRNLLIILWMSNIITLGLHLEFSGKMKIWQVPACKMETQCGIILLNHPPTHPAAQLFLTDRMTYHFEGVNKVCWRFLGSVWRVSWECLRCVLTVSEGCLGFSVWLKIGQVSVCRIKPWSDYIM